MADKKKPTANGIKVVKKSIGERLAETFFGGTIKDAKSFVIHERIVPAIKEMIFESFTGGLDQLLNGNNAHTGYKNYNKVAGGVSIYTPPAVTSYSAISSGKAKPQIGGYSSRNPETLVFYDVKDENGHTIRGRDRASHVLGELQKQIMTAGYATVSDYYDFAEVTAGHFTDNNFGWTDLSTARIMPRDGGYVIALPPADQVK